MENIMNKLSSLGTQAYAFFEAAVSPETQDFVCEKVKDAWNVASISLSENAQTIAFVGLGAGVLGLSYKVYTMDQKMKSMQGQLDEVDSDLSKVEFKGFLGNFQNKAVAYQINQLWTAVKKIQTALPKIEAPAITN